MKFEILINGMSIYPLQRNHFGDPSHAGNVLSRNDALLLLHDWVKNERLQLHMLQVAHLMQCWASEVEQLPPADAWRWELAGLLHDADWEQWPDEHCSRIIDELEKRMTDPEIIHAIASHGPRYFGVAPESKMDKLLYAFDELSGFVHAYSLMRPSGYDGMETKGVIKRMKDKSFAATVSRDDIHDAATRAAIPLPELISFVITHQLRSA